jgi:hypothetical protein
VSVILSYTDSGVSYSLALAVLSMRGLDEPDELRLVGIQHKYLDGSGEDQIQGFQKVITLDFGVVSSPVARRFLAGFVQSEDKVVIYGNLVSRVINDSNLASQWVNDLEVGRRFILRLVDEFCYQSWSDGISGEDLMYFKAKVQIDGTAASPETFTTGSGKLSTMETGAVWPAFSSVTHKFHVSVDGSKYCQAVFALVDKATVSSGHVTFQLYVSDFGNPAADGKYYVDIAIFLQAI